MQCASTKDKLTGTRVKHLQRHTEIHNTLAVNATSLNYKMAQHVHPKAK